MLRRRKRFRRTGFSVNDTPDSSVYGEATLIGCERGTADPVEIITEFRNEGLAVQPVRSDMVFGAEHMMAAYMHATRAFARGKNSSDDIMTEFLMYAACETQITRAIERMKVTSQSGMVLLIAPAMKREPLERMLSRLGLKRDDSLLDVTEGKLDNAAMLGVNGDVSVTDAVIERIAMLDIMKK